MYAILAVILFFYDKNTFNFNFIRQNYPFYALVIYLNNYNYTNIFYEP